MEKHIKDALISLQRRYDEIAKPVPKESFTTVFMYQEGKMIKSMNADVFEEDVEIQIEGDFVYDTKFRKEEYQKAESDRIQQRLLLMEEFKNIVATELRIRSCSWLDGLIYLVWDEFVERYSSSSWDVDIVRVYNLIEMLAPYIKRS